MAYYRERDVITEEQAKLCQAWLRDHQPPTLVAWGEHDRSFVAPGAEAVKRDLPNAEIHLLDAGHFALDEKTDEVADLILQFMAKHPA